MFIPAGHHSTGKSRHNHELKLNGQFAKFLTTLSGSKFDVFPVQAKKIQHVGNVRCIVRLPLRRRRHRGRIQDDYGMLGRFPQPQPILVVYWGVTSADIQGFLLDGATFDVPGTPHPVQKRSTDYSNMCHLHAWNLNFADIGWNWVQHPTRMSMNFCLGGCPATSLITNPNFNMTNHAFFRAVYEIALGASSASYLPAPVCIVKDSDHQSILFTQANGDVSTKILYSVLAKSCGCE